MKDIYFLIQKLTIFAPPFEKSKNKRIIDVVVENVYHHQYIIYNYSENTLQIELNSKKENTKN